MKVYPLFFHFFRFQAKFIIVNLPHLVFSIEFGHQSSMNLTLFCRHRPFFVILSLSSQKYYTISSYYIFYFCCFQAKCSIIYRPTLLILQHKCGHENIVILAQFLSKMAVFVSYTRLLYLLIFHIFVVLQAQFTIVYPLTLSICHIIKP